ncbi:MAG TPA: methyl-accepting chemotaxis protein [Spirochaetota bacterium]|nr:methyl-accepting chemotaxis protein [Spirochaetota bacterium]HPJ33440.1 methyl-accepting chemotaxis protein [Spirochaetota bacterium]
MKQNYNARETLLIKTSFSYMVSFFITMTVGVSFLFISKVAITETIAPITITLICCSLSFISYRLIKNKKDATITIWITTLLSVAIPLVAKFKYAASLGWTFALSSYNSSALLVIMVFLSSLYLREKLLLTITTISTVIWSLFIYLAVINGADYSFDAFKNGEIFHGVVMTREIFFVATGVLIPAISYRWVMIVNQFVNKTMVQNKEIQTRIDQMQEMNGVIKDEVTTLFSEVESQNDLIVKFNEKMQSQAATFEEISATLEELRGSSESIHNTTIEQIDGNVRMDEIIDDFKNIKTETKTNLNSTYTGIQNVSDKTTLANEKLTDVEETMNTIAAQSGKISDTVSIIIDIADKINLLSLNASIEAARAGEHGKGFAVVADEIGKLAFLTTESIKEIEKVLSLNNSVTKKGVDVIKDSSLVIKEMIDEMSGSTGNIKILQDSLMVEEKYINSIIRQMEENINLAKSICTGTDEQKNAIENTSNALEDLNLIVSEMVSEINELAQSSSIIFQSAKDLMKKSEENV